MADELGVAQGTVKSRTFYALRALRGMNIAEFARTKQAA
ncbi:DNA-directed RNA polymerase specialized sigma24 family protein [Actinoplanes lutulentus]|nr:hypothetical protein [Actinoplanes lutulentus]MBB2946468.1 DNA-directed RNA polymerase specialized sigma24 family protein [Actinoplanes lutulentus]